MGVETAAATTAAGAGKSAAATAATTAAAGAVATQVVGSLMAPKTPNAPNAPNVPEPKVMSTADDAAVQKAKTDSIIAQMQRGGRASTILTDNGNNKLGA